MLPPTIISAANATGPPAGDRDARFTAESEKHDGHRPHPLRLHRAGSGRRRPARAARPLVPKVGRESGGGGSSDGKAAARPGHPGERARPGARLLYFREVGVRARGPASRRDPLADDRVPRSPSKPQPSSPSTRPAAGSTSACSTACAGPPASITLAPAPTASTARLAGLVLFSTDPGRPAPSTTASSRAARWRASTWRCRWSQPRRPNASGGARAASSPAPAWFRMRRGLQRPRPTPRRPHRPRRPGSRLARRCFRLYPETGKKHQLLHPPGRPRASPVAHDRLYPNLSPESPDDFAHPLALLALPPHASSTPSPPPPAPSPPTATSPDRSCASSRRAGRPGSARAPRRSSRGATSCPPIHRGASRRRRGGSRRRPRLCSRPCRDDPHPGSPLPPPARRPRGGSEPPLQALRGPPRRRSGGGRRPLRQPPISTPRPRSSSPGRRPLDGARRRRAGRPPWPPPAPPPGWRSASAPPPPLLAHEADLGRELEEASRLARQSAGRHRSSRSSGSRPRRPAWARRAAAPAPRPNTPTWSSAPAWR